MQCAGMLMEKQEEKLRIPHVRGTLASLGVSILYKHYSSFQRAPPWSSSSVLDHRSLPQCSNPIVGISEGFFIFDFTSLPLEVVRLTCAQKWP